MGSPHWGKGDTGRAALWLQDCQGQESCKEHPSPVSCVQASYREAPQCTTTPSTSNFQAKEAPPLSFTGVDFVGTLYVRSDGAAKKVWIYLYTSCVVRVVHLDLVPDLSTLAFLHSFR